MKFDFHQFRYVIAIVLLCHTIKGGVMAEQIEGHVVLPAPAVTTKPSIERLLQQRRSIRAYQAGMAISLSELGQLLWAAQGITHPQGLRTAPSAGALYPLELFIAVGHVDGVPAGLYRYHPHRHQLSKTDEHDLRRPLARAALSQTWIQDAAAVVIITAVYDRTKSKYGERGIRYVHMEVGHAAQNIFLQSEALGLGTAVVGAFHDGQIADLLQLASNMSPLLIMPVGKK